MTDTPRRLDPPAHYDDEHRAIWSEAVTRLTGSGRLFRADPEVLGAYVEAVRSHRQATRLLSQSNVLIIRDGKAMENPALGIQQRAADAMTKTSRALGLDRVPGDPDTPRADAAPPAPMSEARWCEQHQRKECRHNRKDGTPCHQYRLVAGLDVCRKHGGKSIEQLREDGRLRTLEAEAQRLLYQRDAPPVTNPLEALQRLAGRALALEEFIGERTNELRSLRYEGGVGGEQIRGEIQVLERAMDRAGRLLVDIAKLGIEDKLAVIKERTAVMLEQALAAALAASGCDLDGQRRAQEAFKRQLRVVA